MQTPDKVQQAQRVKDYMNYEIMEKMKEYEPEFGFYVISFTFVRINF